MTRNSHREATTQLASGSRAAPADGLTVLAVNHRTSLDPAEAERVLVSPDWLGAPEDEASEAGHRRFLSDLAFPIVGRTGALVLRKAALVDLGPIRRLPDGSVVLELSWRSATFAPLFPVFGGRLLVRTDGIFLTGVYAPPFDEVGRLFDRAILHRVAMRTARWFVGQFADRLTGALPSE